MEIYIHKLFGSIWYVSNEVQEIQKFKYHDYKKVQTYSIKHDIIIDICTDYDQMERKRQKSNYSFANSIMI